MRKTKIICTMGPATDKEGVLERLIEEGMNVARLNFSHADYEEHGNRIARIKKIRKEQNKPVAILLDTKGPEIRLKTFLSGKADLHAGQIFTLKSEEIQGDETQVSITYTDLYKDVAPGSRILIDDGLIEMKVREVSGTDIVCEVLNDGAVSDKKGINVPGVMLSMPYLSQKDKEDILFGIKKC